MQFKIIGGITHLKTFAVGNAIREIDRFRRTYRIGRWRKRKGNATVRLADGSIHQAEVHRYEATGIGRKEVKIKYLLAEAAMSQQAATTRQLVICVRNDEYPASLEVRKVYEVLPDTTAAMHHLIRIVDESGEDYLYPDHYFMLVDLPQPVRAALRLAA